MIYPIAFIVSLALLAFGLAVLRKQHRSRAAAAEAIDEQLTPKEIEHNISQDILSEERPFQPGMFGNDEAGNHYVAGLDGAVRRVMIVPTADGGETVMQVRKLNKA